MTFWEFITFQWLWNRPKPTTTTTTTQIENTSTTTTLPNLETTTTTTKGDKMKKAFTFGINDYFGTQNDLRGCCNDAKNWANLLSTQYGFSVTTLLDSQVTKANVKKTMLDLITTSKAGDSLVFTYSGHGTSVVDTNNDELDGKDEAICLYGNGGIDLLTDDEIREIFNQLPQGVKLVFISDSCFSGSVSRAFLTAMNDASYYSKPKYLPPSDDMEAMRLLGTPTIKAFAYPEEGMNHILISGTNDSSYSYDANIGGQPCGAFSYYAIQVLKNNPKITYADFYKKLSVSLPSQSYPQSPQLEGSESNKNTIMFE